MILEQTFRSVVRFAIPHAGNKLKSNTNIPSQSAQTSSRQDSHTCPGEARKEGNFEECFFSKCFQIVQPSKMF